jgi:hypothetical protein
MFNAWLGHKQFSAEMGGKDNSVCIAALIVCTYAITSISLTYLQSDQ